MDALDVMSFTTILRHFKHVLLVAWNVTCKCYVTAWERVGPGNYFDNVGDAFVQCDETSKFIALLEISFGNPNTEISVFMKKRTVIQRCNSWLDSPGKAGKQWKEVSVSLAFDFVFVYLKPHFGEGGYCAQSRRVPVPGSRLLIKPLDIIELPIKLLTSKLFISLHVCMYARYESRQDSPFNRYLHFWIQEL